MHYRIPALFFAALTALTGCTTVQRAAGSAGWTKQISRQKGLVAFWNFADTSGHPAAGSAREVKLNAYGSARFVKEGILSGWSMELDGKSYWSITHENSSALDIKTNAVTVIAWVKWSGGTGFVAGKWNEYNDGGKRQYGLFVSLPYYNGESQVCGHISKKGGPTPPFPFSIDYSASPQKVPLDEWACVAFTYDENYIRSYFNGMFEERKPELIMHTAGFLEDHPQGLTQVKNPYHYPDGMGNNGSDFTIGAVQLKNGMGNFFKGKIGGIAVFNRALSNKEMKRLAAMP
ncbi:MAG: LamG domain-containing protein [Chitinophagaceae bacterium]|nr:LamG domain-containing protein [Chitinophagaceae bacterium]